MLLGGAAAGIQARVTTAASPSELAGGSQRWGINAGYWSVDILRGDSYWGIQAGIGLGWPGDLHYYEENTVITN